MLTLEWRHPVGTEPAWLMDNGRMVGEWYPASGQLMLYVGRVPDEAKARKVLEVFARAIASPYGADEFTWIQKQVEAIASE